jgi:hypothetical protein
MKKEIFTKMVLINPEKAKDLLKLNKSNRPLNKNTVDWYSKQMKNGQWTISGQTISISDENTLIDGQHRLAAIVKSGKEIMFNVAYNVPYISFINYDSVRSRGMADVFAIEGISNYKSIAAIISKYNNLINGSFSWMGFGLGMGSGGSDKRYKYTNADALDLYNRNRLLFQDIHNASERCYSRIKLFTTSQVGAFMYYLIVDKKHNKEKVMSFFYQLFFNENVENKSIYNLREKLINGSIGQFRMIPKLKYVYLVKCWNSYVSGKEIKNYTFNDSDVMPNFI